MAKMSLPAQTLCPSCIVLSFSPTTHSSHSGTSQFSEHILAWRTLTCPLPVFLRLSPSFVLDLNTVTPLLRSFLIILIRPNITGVFCLFFGFFIICQLHKLTSFLFPLQALNTTFQPSIYVCVYRMCVLVCFCLCMRKSVP